MRAHLTVAPSPEPEVPSFALDPALISELRTQPNTATSTLSVQPRDLPSSATPAGSTAIVYPLGPNLITTGSGFTISMAAWDSPMMSLPISSTAKAVPVTLAQYAVEVVAPDSPLSDIEEVPMPSTPSMNQKGKQTNSVKANGERPVVPNEKVPVDGSGGTSRRSKHSYK